MFVYFKGQTRDENDYRMKEELIMNSNCYTRMVYNIQTNIEKTIEEHGAVIKTVIYMLLGVAYYCYFGYAMYYEFGDEGSVRLMVCTVLATLFVAYILIENLLNRRGRKLDCLSGCHIPEKLGNM